MDSGGLAVVALQHIHGLTEGNVRALLDEYDDPMSALRSYGDGADSDVFRARALVEQWQTAGIHVSTVVSPDYPQQLKDVYNHPPVIYTKGVLPRGREKGVAIVGSRKASPRQCEDASVIAGALVSAGYAVVSGLARGIDGAAHMAALNAHGRTIAVVGTGLDTVYPPEHRDLELSIQRHGLVLSQFAPRSPIRRFSFPMRNVTMSAYALATVVVAAQEHSGTRHQVDAAVKHGRPVIVMRGVVESASWARSLVEDQYVNVHVVDDPREVAAVVDEALAVPADLLALM
ncbi:MAG: DNA-protecting protein DprA [Arcanobacterium sp.]|nr:DNA-protecting protein DprA [Arcanobacterium sp.]MDY6142908.1 DNA-processing protein DprA [Arcanobacterium sp.]